MKNKIAPLCLLFTLALSGCESNIERNGDVAQKIDSTRFQMYSSSVKDTFYISVQLPPGYTQEERKTYPVAYLLDGNLYFDMLAPSLTKYAEVGLAPEVILVGIGYRDFAAMDSLRNRDYTYPVALPEHEMTVSGGADHLLHFIRSGLMPRIDAQFRTDTSRRILVGHSLGGYFSSYALLQNMEGKNTGFSGFVSASPSLNYNKYYLLDRLNNVRLPKAGGQKTRAFFTYGGLEDEEEGEEPGMKKVAVVSAQLEEGLGKDSSRRLKIKTELYSNLGHMDTPLPSLLKGLKWVLEEGK